MGFFYTQLTICTMAFKSKAQQIKLAGLAKAGKFSQKTYDRWATESPAALPERVETKAKLAKKKSQRYVEQNSKKESSPLKSPVSSKAFS